jgi:hypothetical protein
MGITLGGACEGRTRSMHHGISEFAIVSRKTPETQRSTKDGATGGQIAEITRFAIGVRFGDLPPAIARRGRTS